MIKRPKIFIRLFFRVAAFIIAGTSSCASAVLQVRYGMVELELVANSEREFPLSWISSDRSDVSDEFLRYVRPLVGEDFPSVPMLGGRQRFACLRAVFADKKLPSYVPQAYRLR